ncbi:MAG: citrate synthase [Clostridia bacterium]|nr:citrate synthase [Clostridia bacterium]
MLENINPISPEKLAALCERIERKSAINHDDFWKYGVKRGLRNHDGTGVMAGLTKICSVEGYYILDGEKVPEEGILKFRGFNINDIIEACERENRFGFEEVVYLLIFGSLPSKEQLSAFRDTLALCRDLPETFIEDVLMRNAQGDIMNKLARCVLTLYSYDEDPDSVTVENVLRQSIQIIAQMPVIMCYAYQAKRKFMGKSMYFHADKKELSTAETILRSLRSDRKFTDEEARLLDTILILHTEHGGGNNSTFTSRVLTSSGTDTYSAFAGAIGSLKGPKHGGANIKVRAMLEDMTENIEDITDEKQVGEYIEKIIKKEAGDGSGLIYGMGHAVYTLSDPRAVILKRKAKEFASKYGFEKEYRLIELVETLTPDIFRRIKGINKPMCANVDLYSGLVLKILRIPEELYTPIFATARVAGWAAHRIEELITGGKIMRPAYKSIALPKKYVSLEDRTDSNSSSDVYVPTEQRILRKEDEKNEN